jgi:hypothetical protein
MASMAIVAALSKISVSTNAPKHTPEAIAKADKMFTMLERSPD